MRKSHQSLSCRAYFVFQTCMAEPHEIPESFGVWLLKRLIESGTLEVARSERHLPCKLSFTVWMALAWAISVGLDGNVLKRELGDMAVANDAVIN